MSERLGVTSMERVQDKRWQGEVVDEVDPRGDLHLEPEVMQWISTSRCMPRLCDSVRSWEMGSNRPGSMKHVVPRSLMAYPTASRRTSFAPFSDNRSRTVMR